MQKWFSSIYFKWSFCVDTENLNTDSNLDSNPDLHYACVGQMCSAAPIIIHSYTSCELPLATSTACVLIFTGFKIRYYCILAAIHKTLHINGEVLAIY